MLSLRLLGLCGEDCYALLAFLLVAFWLYSLTYPSILQAHTKSLCFLSIVMGAEDKERERHSRSPQSCQFSRDFSGDCGLEAEGPLMRAVRTTQRLGEHPSHPEVEAEQS